MQKILLSALVIAGAVSAQTISMPAFNSTFTSTLTRGFWFQAPIGFTITGIEVYNEAAQPFQVVEVIDLGPAAPPAYPGTVVGTQLHYDNATPTGGQVPMAVPIAPGQFIGILCACNPSVGSATSYNSYSVTPGPFVQSILGQPITLDRFGTQSGIGANGGNQPCWQETGFNIARADVYISTLSGFATKLTFGDGCYDAASASFYEEFVNTPIDLQNTSLTFTNAGNGYVVLPVGGAWYTPTSTAITMGDDVVVTQALGFSMPYPGGTTTDVHISSNGFVYAQPDNNNGCCSGVFADLLSGTPRWAALWNDLNPSAGGSVYIDVDPVNSVVYVTFDQVPRYGTSDLNTFQYVFPVSGNVEIRWLNCAATTGTTLIGWSPGMGVANPGAVDISATPVIITQPDSVALALDANARPVLGTSVNLTVSNIPSGTAIAAVIYGLTQNNPGIDLTFIGMPGCFQYCSQEAIALYVSPASSVTNVFNVPNNPAFAGVDIQSQGAAFNPGGGHNALDAVSSNGLSLGLDIN